APPLAARGLLLWRRVVHTCQYSAPRKGCSAGVVGSSPLTCDVDGPRSPRGGRPLFPNQVFNRWLGHSDEYLVLSTARCSPPPGPQPGLRGCRHPRVVARVARWDEGGLDNEAGHDLRIRPR